MGSMRITAAGALVAVALLAGACGGQSSTTPESGGPAGGEAAPASEAEQLAKTKCTLCHTYDRVEQATKSAEEWQTTIDRMVDHGLVVTDEEKAAITAYLSGTAQ